MQWAGFEEDRGSNSGAIMNAVMLDVKNYAPIGIQIHVLMYSHSLWTSESVSEQFRAEELLKGTVLETAGDLFHTLITEQIMQLISEERFVLPVGVFFQPLLLACLNVL